MKRTTLLLLFASVLATSRAGQTLTLTVTNPMSQPRSDQPVVISLTEYGNVRSALVTTAGKEIPCQLDDLNQDEEFDELCFLADLDKKETKTYTVILSDEGEPRSYPARVYAEMVMANTKDKTLKKHQQNNYIESITARGDAAYTYNLQHHHGVDFESELNGIRIYFDARQTLDLYGKFKKQLELKETQFYTTDEQKSAGYGDDVLWVGQTFGLGAFRGWDGQKPTHVEPVRTRTQRIISYGPLRTIVEVIDRGWQAPLGTDASAPKAQTSSSKAQTSNPDSQTSSPKAQTSSPDSQASSSDSQASCPKAHINMTLRYTQYAGHRDTDVDVIFNKDVSNYRFSTGIINVKGSVEFSDKQGLRACWGTDYPSTDTLKWKRETVGLAVLVPKKNIVSEEPANKDNYAYVLKVGGNSMSYKVNYTSANETFGYHSSQEWFDYLQAWRKEVESPVKVELKKL